MRVEDFKIGFSIVYLIFGLDSWKKCIELNESTTFLFNVNNFTDSAEVGKYVVKTVMVVVFGQRSNKKYFRWAILYQKLFRIRIN